MSRFNKLIFTLVSFIFSVTAVSQTLVPGFSKRINSYLKEEIRETGTTGLAVAVVQNGKVIYKNAFGTANIEWETPVTRKTVFQTASVTKLFTSTLILKWAHEGRLQLTDNITQYLPDAPERWSGIQICHLLSHQSGLPWPACIGGFIGLKKQGSGKAATKEQIYKDIRDSVLTFEPGTKESYMNGDHFILQIILESLAQKSLPRIMEEELLQPLGMEDGGYDSELREFPLQLMKPLRHKSQLYTKGDGNPYILKNFYNPNSYTSAGLYLSLDDVIKWATALDKNAVTNKAMTDSLYLPMPIGGFTQFGWVKEKVCGFDAYGHSGGPGLSHILRIPEVNVTVIVLSNYADLLPYMAYGITGLLFNKTNIDAKGTKDKTLNRGLGKRI